MQDNKAQEFQSLAKQEENILGKLIFQKMSVEDYMYEYDDEHPALYVGTYRKYNEGSLFGMWVDLVKCGDYDTFMEVCHNLHADEEDPELMYQDFMYFPEGWYSECGIDEEMFDKIIEYAEMGDKKAFEAWTNATGDDDVEKFRDRYMGEWDSEEEFAEHIVNECYDLDNMMGSLSSYFDYKSFAYDLFHSDYTYDNGFVWRDF